MLVVPVCGESPSFLDDLLIHQRIESILTVMVVNRPTEHDKSAQWFTENQLLIERLNFDAESKVELSKQHHLLLNVNGHDVMLLDFNDQPFDHRKGVGLARKIGADTALKMIQLNWISNPWIFSTDADVELPIDYFSVVNKTNHNQSAICLDFVHSGSDPKLCDYQNQYDFKLRYYQQGMKYIGSKYDYIPLGSTLIIEASAYAKVRGFPSRSGGEDFYILNKLAKVGGIYQPKMPKVKIKIRLSDRVPFGTGPAISQIKQLEQQGGGYKLYHPDCFYIIKQWRDDLLNYFDHQKLPHSDCGLNDCWHIGHVLENGFKQSKSHQRWQQFIHEWFDAFKILKSVHFLSESLPVISQLELLRMQRYQEIAGC